jgi:FkbM family methyltransferase
VLWTPSFGQALFLTNEIFIERCYEVSLPERPLILDCGANTGTSLLYFAHVFRDSRLVAFEPDPDAFELLERTVRDNDMTVELHQLALGREEGAAILQTDAPASVHATLSSSLAEGTTVQVAPLSPYVPPQGVDLLKLDVEGSELRVLEELREARALSRVRALVVEVHPELGVTPESVHALLEENGFTVDGERLLSGIRRRDSAD